MFARRLNIVNVALKCGDITVSCVTQSDMMSVRNRSDMMSVRNSTET
jgi:hypothetical protein